MKVKKQAERIKELLAKNLGRFLMGSVGLRGRARNLEHSVVSRSHSECRARIECTCFRASELRGQFLRLGPKQSQSQMPSVLSRTPEPKRFAGQA